MDFLPYALPVGLFALAFGYLWLRVVWTTHDLDSKRMNSMKDWTPGPNRGAPIKWSMTDLVELGRQIVAEELEAGEACEGFARGFFSPQRNWSLSLRRLKCPLIIAATPRRILMFELDTGMTANRFRFVGFDEIQYLSPPEPAAFGTSTALRFGLNSGEHYQLKFVGPMFSEEGMRQEQRLSAYLRLVAARFPKMAEKWCAA